MSPRAKQSRKLIDSLGSAVGVAAPHSMLATTFELDPDFVEHDFFPALLGIPAWEDRSVRTRVVLEASLAKLDAAVLLTEAHCFRGRPRSLRVHVTAAHVPNRILHAKVVLIVAPESVRLIVGSANLTTNGYRLNREAVVSFSASMEDPEEGALIRQALSNMPTLLASWWSPSAQTVVDAGHRALDAIRAPKRTIDEQFVWSGGEVALWEQFLGMWPERETVERIKIVSPFWSDDVKDGPIVKLANALRQRKALVEKASVLLLTNATPEKAETYVSTLPPAYRTFDFRTVGLDVAAAPVSPQVDKEDVSGVDVLRPRQLHAKVVLLEGSETTLAYVGSANFTRKGWGFGGGPANIEAGLVIRRVGKGRKALQDLVPKLAREPKRLIGDDTVTLGMPPPIPDPSPWPLFLRRAELVPRDGAGGSVAELELVLTIAPPEASAFSIAFEDNGDDRETFTPPFRGDEIRFSLSAADLRILIRTQMVCVRWNADGDTLSSVLFPINVAAEAREQLPFGESDSLPGEGDLIDFYQGRLTLEDIVGGSNQPPIDDGPSIKGGDPSQVDTSRILSYRIRSFVDALAGMQQELERNTANIASMRLALLGPVSPVALAREVQKAVSNGRSPTAAGFQLVELLRVLTQCRSFVVDPRLVDEWRQAIGRAEIEIRGVLEEVTSRSPELSKGMFARYHELALTTNSAGGAS